MKLGIVRCNWRWSWSHPCWLFQLLHIVYLNLLDKLRAFFPLHFWSVCPSLSCEWDLFFSDLFFKIFESYLWFLSFASWVVFVQLFPWYELPLQSFYLIFSNFVLECCYNLFLDLSVSPESSDHIQLFNSLYTTEENGLAQVINFNRFWVLSSSFRLVRTTDRLKSINFFTKKLCLLIWLPWFHGHLQCAHCPH